MAQRQNAFAALLAALTLAPKHVHEAQKTGASNEEKHQRVFGGLAEAAQIGGAIAAAQNPLYAALINAAVQVAVESAKETNFAEPEPVHVADGAVLAPTPVPAPGAFTGVANNTAKSAIPNKPAPAGSTEPTSSKP